MRPLLTIAVPTYRGAGTIKNMLDLLLPQCTEEVEVFVSDNCSPDDTGKIIASYLDRYPFLKYHRNETNIGPDANFLQCMRLAEGRFTWLVSDDDIVAGGAVCAILSFLKGHPDVGLVYLTTRDFRASYPGIGNCSVHKPEVKADLCTKDKSEFMKYAGAYWGFMSSYLYSTDRFRRIKNAGRFFGTFWLQSYVYALCAAGRETELGVVRGPCVGAGIYVNTANFDSSLVNGVYYRRMLDFMVKRAGFEAAQLDRLFVKRICLLGRHDILKEKASGSEKLDKRRFVRITVKYPRAWLTVYPAFLVPGGVCRAALGFYRRARGIREEIRINREE